MATIQTYTGTKIKAIADATVVDGNVDVNKHLILEQRNGTQIDGGLIQSPKGDTGLERALPAGQVTLYAGNLPPTGWTWCDGSEQLRSAYPELFAVIGTKYGSGDGTTTFNLPNMGSRLAVGMDSAQTEFNDLGVSGGEINHLLTINELPAHDHGISGYKGVDDKNFSGNLGRLQASDSTTPYNNQTSLTGDSLPHNNLQPYITLTYIISTGKPSGSHPGGVSAPRRFTSVRRGTTAERDALYPAPSTVAQQVALANQKVIWFNTDLGWEESYYAVTLSSGLTALGLITGAPAGWYPTGKGPYIQVDGLALTTVALNSYIGNWGNQVRKGGSSWFTLTNADTIDVFKYGRYDLKFWTIQGGGTNTADYVLAVTEADGTTIYRGGSGGAFTRDTGFQTRPNLEMYDTIIPPGKKVRVKLQSGTLTGPIDVHTSSTGIRGRLFVRYVGPPLVTD
jgi:microcystin-dependent protein